MVNGKLHHIPSQGHVLQENQDIIKTVEVSNRNYICTPQKEQGLS